MTKYIISMIEEGKKIIEKENKLRMQCGLSTIGFKDENKGYYDVAKLKDSSNDIIVQSIGLGKYVPFTLVFENDSLQRCITNESCYLLNISKRNDLEESRCKRIVKYIDTYNSIMDSAPTDSEYEIL